MIAESAMVFSMACSGLSGTSLNACSKGTQAAAIQSGAAQYAEDVGKYIEKKIPLNDTAKAAAAITLKYSYDKSISTEFCFKFLNSDKMYVDHKDNVKSILGLKWEF